MTVTEAIVLPEKLGVTAVVEGEDKVSFTVGDYGNYTMVVNDYTDPDKAFTIFVRRPEYVEVPEGYTLIEYKPGLHFVDNIFLQGNTVLYLHAGAFLVAKKPAGPTGEISNAFIYANAADNLKIVGHGVIDFSQLPWHARRGVYIGNSNGVEMNGVTLINASSWASTFMYCKNLTVRDCIIFGYRTNSDAYAVCSCEDGEIVDCFARSGDDLFEVKTYSAPLKNILFENCTAFPDNCRGFGLTQESNSLLTDITYRNCSLLYQLNDWASHMSAFNIDAGEQGSISGLTFEKCDLFYSKVYAVHISVGENEWTMGVKGYNNSATNITFRECSFKYPVSGRGFMKVRNTTSEVNAIDNVFFDRCTIGENGTPIASLSTFPDGAVDYEGLTTPSSAFRFA